MTKKWTFCNDIVIKNVGCTGGATYITFVILLY